MSLVLLSHEGIQRYISIVFYIQGPGNTTIERNKSRNKWSGFHAYLALFCFSFSVSDSTFGLVMNMF